MYESGRYVIFAVGKVNTMERVRNYVDLFALRLLHLQERQNAIDELIKASVHSCSVDVRPDDQLLVLVTCVENENERRVVAARRIRDGENETELKKSWREAGKSLDAQKKQSGDFHRSFVELKDDRHSSAHSHKE